MDVGVAIIILIWPVSFAISMICLLVIHVYCEIKRDAEKRSLLV